MRGLTIPYVVSAGVLQIGAALQYWVATDLTTKLNCVKVLSCILLIDAFIAHYPLSEFERGQGKELDHFTIDLTILGGLWMLVGFRHEP